MTIAKVRIRARLAVRKAIALVRRATRYFATGSDERLLSLTFVDHTDNNKLTFAAAKERGIEIKQLPSEVLMLEFGGRRAFSQGTGFQFESMITHVICADKELSSLILEMSGLPVPKFRAFNLSTYDDAVAFLHDLPGSAVVKPCRGTWGGAGVTVGVDTEKEMESAFLDALMHCGDVIVEEFVPGTCYRFTVLDDKVVSVERMSHASVTGDGKLTIGELVRRQNDNLSDGLYDLEGQRKKINIDRETERMLSRRGLTMSHVPGKGDRVQLKGTANSSVGGSTYHITEGIHPEVLELALRATEAVRARLCGVDIIAQNASAPLAEAGAYLNEVNTTPGLYGIGKDIHHRILDILFSPDEKK